VAKLTKGMPDVDVSVIPPHPFLIPVLDALKGSNVALGAQNLYIENKGAFTGASLLLLARAF
jgi:triosephosphate isomerase